MSDEASDGDCAEGEPFGPRFCTFGVGHAGDHSWEARPAGVRIAGAITEAEVRERAAAGSPAAGAMLAAAGERVLVRKVLTLEVFRRDPESKKPGPVLATVKGWDAFDEFLAQHGTKLVRSTWMGVKTISMPTGWDSTVVGMENHYSDGTVEVM